MSLTCRCHRRGAGTTSRLKLRPARATKSNRNSFHGLSASNGGPLRVWQVRSLNSLPNHRQRSRETVASPRRRSRPNNHAHWPIRCQHATETISINKQLVDDLNCVLPNLTNDEISSYILAPHLITTQYDDLLRLKQHKWTVIIHTTLFWKARTKIELKFFYFSARVSNCHY